jgi:iron complex outermembrane receptor protein
MAIVTKKGSIRRAARCSTSLLALLPVVMALSMAEQASAQQTASNNSIDEVVITAQHRAQSDKDVAETVSAINPDNLDEFSAGGADITFLNARVPSLYASSSYGRTYPVFSIRGFGDNDFDYNAQQPVAVIYDGVVLQNPILKAFPVFDSAGLEVAKGPQGTLYGTDTPGGVLKIDSQKPTDKFEGYGDVAYGTYDTTSFNGAVNVPIIEGKLSLRVSLLEEYRDNWVHNNYAPDTRAQNVNGYDDTAGRIQLLFTPDADTSVLLNIHARNMDGTSTLFRANAEEPGTNNLAPGYKADEVAFDDLYTQKLETKGASLTIDHDFGLIKLTSVSGWESGRILSRGDLDGGYYNSVTGATNIAKNAPYDLDSASQDVIPNLQQYTQEVRLSNDPNSRFFNQGGVFVFHDLYQDMTYEYEDNTTTGGTVLDNPLGELLNTRQSAVSWGIFDSATYKVTDQLTVQAGVRDSHDYKDLTLERYFIDPNFGASYLINPGTNGYLKNTARVGGSLISWDGSLDYKISDEMSAYFRAARGGKGPAIEARDTFADNISTAKQEVTTSYEGGLKSDFWGRKLRLNVDGYVWNDRDAQITSTGGAQNLILLQNAANVEGYGAEVEATLKPFNNLLLNGGFGYNHTEIQDPNLYTSPCSNGCTVTSPLVTINGSQLASLNHSALQNAPLWTANWNARYTLPINDDSSVFAFTDWTYRSAVLTTAYNSVESNVKPLTIGGLRIGYENYNLDLEVSGFVRNIMNTVQVIGVAIDFVPGDSNAYINDPRTFGFEIKKRF